MATVNAPTSFRVNLGELPLGLEWSNRVRPPLDLIVAFHTKRSVLAANWPLLTSSIAQNGAIWIAWPKRMSGVETDLSDTAVREELLRGKWVDNKVCAIDETFTALRFCIRVEQRKKRTPTAAKPARLVRSKPGAHR